MKKNKTNNKIKLKLDQQFSQAKHGQRVTDETQTHLKIINKCEQSRGKNTKTSKIEFKTENPYLLLEDFGAERGNNGV